MTRFKFPVSPEPMSICLEAVRCWRRARDTGGDVQPSLFRVLEKRGQDMLAPVLDGLMLLFEAALGRRFAAGEGGQMSEDEHLLFGLLDGSKSRRACLQCPEASASALDCALCSTRIMLALGRPAGAVAW